MNFSAWNENLMGLNAFICALQERIRPYAEAWKIIEQNIVTALSEFAEKTKSIRAFYILAEHQFTFWKPLSNEDVNSIIAACDVDMYLLERIEDKNFINYDILYDEMEKFDLLSKANKSILQQSFKAMELGLYDLTLVGLVVVFDGVLSVTTSDASTSIKNRFKHIRNKMENLSDEEWENLNNEEITAFGMYITWTKTMEAFQADSEFAKPETEPQGVNRHWIAHGRKTASATKLDCCKMINALYGLFYFGSSTMPEV